METIDIVFDGPPSHESGRFVEVENSKGESIKFGEWIERDDGYWVLRIPDYRSMKPPEKLNAWLYAVIKEARRTSYMDFIENWDISEDQDDAIMKWFETMTGKRPD